MSLTVHYKGGILWSFSIHFTIAAGGKLLVIMRSLCVKGLGEGEGVLDRFLGIGVPLRA